MTAKTITLFYTAEGITKLDHIEIDAEATFAAAKAAIVAKHGLAADSSIFLEDDDDDPVDEGARIAPHAAKHGGVKVHVHRCKQVDVSVTYNGRTVERRFRPAATLARVKRWAADEFKLGRDEVGEHVLQLSGTTERPPANTHVGALAKCPDCRVGLDLVPNERVNGASVSQ